MDNQRLEELINAAGYTAEAFRYNGQSVVSVTLRNKIPFLGGLSNIVYRCATPEEASDLVRRTYIQETPTGLILYWPHSRWIL